MDGRVQLPVIKYLQKRFQVEYIDVITEAGPNLILAEQKDKIKIESILEKLEISLKRHYSGGIAIVGHYDCAGNLSEPEEQQKHLQKAISFIESKYQGLKVIGLWVDKNWQVQKVLGK